MSTETDSPTTRTEHVARRPLAEQRGRIVLSALTASLVAVVLASVAGAPTVKAATAVVTAHGSSGFVDRAATGWTVRLVRVSRSDPYAKGCGIAGVMDPQANTEPSIAVDPLNPRREVVAFHGAWRDGGGFVDDLVMRSADSGSHWQRMPTPLTTVCTGAHADRNSDPWVAFGPDGRAYFASLPGRLDREGFPVTRVLIHRSNLAASRFDRPNVAAAGGFNDRESLTVDPHNPHRLYVTWRRGSGALRLRSVLLVGISSDGGRSWRQTVALRPPTGVGFFVPDGAHIVVLPNGTLLDMFLVYEAAARWPILAIRSTDGGRTWSQPRTLGYATLSYPGDSTDGIRTNMLPVAQSATDTDGTAYVVWNDNAAGASRVLLASSRDSGRSWSQPRIVAAPGAQVLLPAVTVAHDHTVCVTYYDFRHDRPGNGKLTTDVWYAISRDHAHHWSEGHVAGPFDMKGAEHLIDDMVGAGTGAGYYLGDYTTVAAQGTSFAAALSLATPYAPPDQPAIYVAKISPR